MSLGIRYLQMIIEPHSTLTLNIMCTWSLGIIMSYVIYKYYIGEQILSREENKSNNILVRVSPTRKNCLCSWSRMYPRSHCIPRNSQLQCWIQIFISKSTWPLNFLIWFCFHFERNEEEEKKLRMWI